MLSALLHAPTLSFLSRSNPSPISPPPMATSALIAVVGDVHNYWHLEDDTKALQLLQTGGLPLSLLSSSESVVGTFEESSDKFVIRNRRQIRINFLRVFHLNSQMWCSLQAGFFSQCVAFCVLSAIMSLLRILRGDFGEQNVELVQSVANLKFPKAVILGNHDAWYTQQFSGKRKDGVRLQLESLGDAHVAYQCLDFPPVKVSVVGGRPFSCGGQKVFRKKLLSARYGVEDMDGSAKKIYKAALSAPEDHFVILLAHNGPTGLGSNLDDICGKDWVIEAGDHGDSDLEHAISLLKESNNVSVPLVVFGHMHKELAHGNGLRKMIVVSSDDTIYLNGAIVPRVKTLIDSKSFTQDEVLANHSLQESEATMRAFTVVDISDGRVDKISESWVSVVGDKATLEEENLLFKRGN